MWAGGVDFAAAIPAYRRAIELIPYAGFSSLQVGVLLAWVGHYY